MFSDFPEDSSSVYAWGENVNGKLGPIADPVMEYASYSSSFFFYFFFPEKKK
jgi:hypothetical protein